MLVEVQGLKHLDFYLLRLISCSGSCVWGIVTLPSTSKVHATGMLVDKALRMSDIVEISSRLHGISMAELAL